MTQGAILRPRAHTGHEDLDIASRDVALATRLHVNGNVKQEMSCFPAKKIGNSRGYMSI